MLSFKQLTIAASVLLMISCSESRLAIELTADKLPPFVEDENLAGKLTASFFKEVPGFGNPEYAGGKIVKPATSVTVYRSTFSEKSFEKNNLLEISLYNDSGSIPHADYRDIKRYSQDLYLLRFGFEWKPEKTNADPIPEQGIVFFTVKKNRDDQILAIQPCYFGVINADYNYIALSQTAKFKQPKTDLPYLKIFKKNIRRPGLLLMPEKDLAAAQPADKLTIIKIVNLNPNKIGGSKPLVFNISEIFRDKAALQFNYVTTLTIQP